MADPKELRALISARVLSHDYSNGPLLLLAGPGTGKTFSLLETIKSQSQQGYGLDDFFEATLTNAAADDFLRDAKKQIAPEFQASTTLHFRAKGILHQHAAQVGIDPGFTVVDPYCEDVLIEDLSTISSTGRRQIKGALRNYRESSAKLEQKDTGFASLYRKLQNFYRAIDWFDVVFLACRALAENPDIHDEESKRFAFLLIDEYQDLNQADQRLIELLLNGRSTFLAVGDDDQSIYSARFADPTGITQFDSRYPAAELMSLPVTSRLPSNVAQASHSLISRNSNRYPKDKLITLPKRDQKTDMGFVVSVDTKSDKAERQFMVEAIRALIAAGVDASQIIVLCNCRALGTELVNWMQNNIDGISIQNSLDPRSEEDEFLYLLNQVAQFLEDPNRNLPLRLILQVVLASDPDAASQLATAAYRSGLPISEYISTRSELELPKSAIDRLSTLKGAFAATERYENSAERMKEFLARVPPLSHLLELIPQDDEDHEARGETEPVDSGRVRFLTMHSSKGLDAEFVFIPFMEESLDLPANDTEEKRRLFYVALTRAKVGAVISWAWSRRSDARFKCSGTGGGFINRKPSPFIAELGISPRLAKRRDGKTSAETALGILQHHARQFVAVSRDSETSNDRG